MTASPDRRRRPGGLALERLLAAVRVEFRAEVLVFAATDPVFGGGACRVPACRRAARSHGMCQGHHLRWVTAGRPDLDVFAATTDPRWARQRPNTACRVTGCNYGVARRGLCQLHAAQWTRSARTDLQAWLADPPPLKAPTPGSTCRIDCCSLWPQGS